MLASRLAGQLGTLGFSDSARRSAELVASYTNAPLPTVASAASSASAAPGPVGAMQQLGTLVPTATPVPNTPSTPMWPSAPAALALTARGALRPSELATGMEHRFVYTRGDPVRDCSAVDGANGANGLTGLKCFTVNEPVFAQKQYYALIVHLDSVPSSATRLVVVSEGTRGLGDPELAFAPSEGVYAMEGSERRSSGGVRVGAGGTRVVYVVDDARSFLRAVDETTGASNEVAVRSNWATGPADQIVTVYVHPSVARAVFLWSDAPPTATASL